MKKLLLLLMIVPMIGFGQCISGDCENGLGTFLYEGGESLDGTIPFDGTYVGEFKDGKFHGKGTYNMDDIGQYSGEFKDGKFHGKGTLDGGDLFKYVGEWVNGRKHGQGIETYPYIGDKYDGEWIRGKYHVGTMTYENGDKYVGEFKTVMEHGKGKMTYADGTVEEGLWEMGEFIGKE